jgi:hypothetical protein
MVETGRPLALAARLPNGLPADPNAAQALITELHRLGEANRNHAEKEEWKAANYFFFEAKRLNVPYRAFLHPYPALSVLATKPEDMEAEEIFLFILRERWRRMTSHLADPPLMPTPQVLYAKQAELMGLPHLASFNHRCAGRDAAGDAACFMVCFKRGDRAHSFLLRRDYVALGNVFVCDRTGKRHICNDTLCDGDMLLDKTTRKCSISAFAKHRECLVGSQQRTGANDGGYGEGVTDGADYDSGGEGGEYASAAVASRAGRSRTQKRLRERAAGAPLSLAPSAPPTSSTLFMDATTTHEPLFDLNDDSDGRQEGKQGRRKLEVTAIEARLIGSQTSDVDLHAAFAHAVTEARVAGVTRQEEDNLAQTIFSYGGTTTALLATQNRAEQEGEQKLREEFVAGAQAVVMKRRARHAAPDLTQNGTDAGLLLDDSITSGVFDVVKRDKVVQAMSDTVSDVLCGSAAVAVRAGVLAKSDIEAKKHTASYVNQCYDAGAPVILTTLLAIDCEARERDAWCPRSGPQLVDWSVAEVYYVRLLLALWDAFGPFIYASVGRRTAKETQAAMSTNEPVRFAVGFLYYMSKASYEYDTTVGGERCSMLVLPCDEFLQRYLVRQAQLAQLKNRQGRQEYKPNWIYQLKKMIEMALGNACQEYERRGRIHDISFESIHRAASRRAYTPRLAH